LRHTTNVGDTQYVLAQAGESYIAYSPSATEIGLRDVPGGAYSLTWLDCATGREVHEHAVEVEGGDWLRPSPEALGPEVALHIVRHAP
jgi:hypothetical protein